VKGSCTRPFCAPEAQWLCLHGGSGCCLLEHMSFVILGNLVAYRLLWKSMVCIESVSPPSDFSLVQAQHSPIEILRNDFEWLPRSFGPIVDLFQVPDLGCWSLESITLVFSHWVWDRASGSGGWCWTPVWPFIDRRSAHRRRTFAVSGGALKVPTSAHWLHDGKKVARFTFLPYHTWCRSPEFQKNRYRIISVRSKCISWTPSELARLRKPDWED